MTDMLKKTPRILFLLASLTWILVGLFLLTFGIHLEITALHTPYFPDQPFSLLAHIMPLFNTTKENALFLVLCVALFIGYIKGKYVLRKTADKQIKRILSLPAPYRISMLYNKKYLLLILSMMSLGMLLRFLPIHMDVRGFIDIAVGAALIHGATHFFPVIQKAKTQ